MWIVCLADESHEMSRLIFYEKYKKKYFKVSSAAIVIGAFKVKDVIVLCVNA